MKSKQINRTYMSLHGSREAYNLFNLLEKQTIFNFGAAINGRKVYELEIIYKQVLVEF